MSDKIVTRARIRRVKKKPPPPAPTSRRGAFVARLRNYLLTGILVVAPIGITVYLAYLLINFVDNQVTPLIPVRYNPETYLPFGLPGLGLLVMFLFLVAVGWATTGYVGKVILRAGENMVGRMPVLRSVYGAIKQILDTILAQQSTAFRHVVLVEYPRRGIWAIGFVSSETEGEIQNASGDRLINVFLPTTPNPTSGFLLFVPAKDLYVLHMSIEEGAKMVISGGLVTPPDRRTAAQRRKKPIQEGAAVATGKELIKMLRTEAAHVEALPDFHDKTTRNSSTASGKPKDPVS